MSNFFAPVRYELNLPGCFYLRTFQQTPGAYPKPPTNSFMKEFLSFGGLGMSGVCSRGMLGFP